MDSRVDKLKKEIEKDHDDVQKIFNRISDEIGQIWRFLKKIHPGYLKR